MPERTIRILLSASMEKSKDNHCLDKHSITGLCQAADSAVDDYLQRRYQPEVLAFMKKISPFDVDLQRIVQFAGIYRALSINFIDLTGISQ